MSRTPRFTHIPTRIIEDRRLSFDALGLLAYLLSKPGGWEVNPDQLAAAHPDGDRSVDDVLQELAELGYLE